MTDSTQSLDDRARELIKSKHLGYRVGWQREADSVVRALLDERVALAQPTALVPADPTLAQCQTEAELLDAAYATLSGVFARNQGALLAFARGISANLIDDGWSPPSTAAPQENSEPADARDAARSRWLAPRMLAADFDYGGDGTQALVFEMPAGFRASADYGATIDAAMAAAPLQAPTTPTAWEPLNYYVLARLALDYSMANDSSGCVSGDMSDAFMAGARAAELHQGITPSEPGAMPGRSTKG